MEQVDHNPLFIKYDMGFLSEIQMMDEFAVYRQPWETELHWALKREFLEAYKNRFDEQRLICLAQAYSNIMLFNCWYPDPVIQQISELSKPLEMRKKFLDLNQESADINRALHLTEPKDFPSEPKDDKINKESEQDEKPLKKMKVSHDEEMSSSTSMVQSLEEELADFNCVPLCDKQIIGLLKSEQSSTTSPCSKKPRQQFIFQVKDISIEKEKENKIISALGLPFIQKFAGIVKELMPKFSLSTELLQHTCRRLGYQRHNVFNIDPDPDIPNVFHVKFFIKDCELSYQVSKGAKTGKALASEIAINTLIKLSASTSERVEPDDSVEECKLVVPRITDSMLVLEIFKSNILKTIKEEPAVETLKRVASLVDMEDYISYDIVSDTTSASEPVYTCKFFLGDVLMSYAKDETNLGAKANAVDRGVTKLLNLEDYEIQNDELKRKIKQVNETDHSINIFPSSKIPKNFEKPPFILNNVLYESSMKDNFVMMERDKFKVNMQKDFRTVLSECANFCRGRVDFELEDIPGDMVPTKKVTLRIRNEVVGVGLAHKKDIAKTIACYRAYYDLKKKYYTLRVKDKYLDGFLITRVHVFEGEPYSKYRVKKINMGFKVKKTKHFRSEDWKEKQKKFTLGKKPKQYNMATFKMNVIKILREYSKCGDFCDLLFANEFSLNEKIEINRFAKKLHVCKFHPIHQFVLDDEGNEYMGFRHPYDIRKIIKHLAKNEGYSTKFELIDDSETY